MRLIDTPLLVAQVRGVILEVLFLRLQKPAQKLALFATLNGQRGGVIKT
tara:strand:+ start:46 stop:192 length:147 start_codon:yes stop_codon:yes gene_type:complete